MSWFQRKITIAVNAKERFQMITREIRGAMPEIETLKAGMLNIFLQHTSASLTINENADPDVMLDLERFLDDTVPRNYPYTHTMEGPDDMPAHIKSSFFGCSLNIPVGEGKLLLGTWQGIYLCEHRHGRHQRSLILTLWGESNGF